MAIELTRDQAAVLRHFALQRQELAQCLFVLRAANYLRYAGDGGDLITRDGLEALVKHDRQKVTVKRDDLERATHAFEILSNRLRIAGLLQDDDSPEVVARLKAALAESKK